MKIKKLFQLAERKKIAIGHFNVSNVETFQAAVLASKRTRTPIVIATSEGAIEHSGLDFFVGAKEFYEKKYKIELYLHLDHGKNIDLIKEVVRRGYDSVMIDASHQPFDENVETTSIITSYAHRYGVAVEAEIGTIGEEGKRGKIEFTDPLDAKEFVQRTNCDFLAVAIGTSHGIHKFLKKSKLDFNLLKEINNCVDIPLVLHGASGIRKDIVRKLRKYGVRFSRKTIGVSDNDIRKAIAGGIRKVNIDTDLQLSMLLELCNQLRERREEIKLYKILGKVREAMMEEAVRKIRLFGGK